MARRYNQSLDRAPSRFWLMFVPVASVMLGSISTILPLVATAPVLPPFGLLMMLAWRLLHRTLWPVWAALPLGLFDDMFSGQPLGSAAFLWTLVFLVIDLFDRRMMWRDYWQDWGIGAGLITGVLTGELIMANATGGETGWLVIAPQIVVAILLLPLAMRLSATLDRFRWML
jgi:rod shape-determining protein MreD